MSTSNRISKTSGTIGKRKGFSLSVSKSGFDLWFVNPATGKRIKRATGCTTLEDAQLFMFRFDPNNPTGSGMQSTQSVATVQPSARSKNSDAASPSPSPNHRLSDWIEYDNRSKDNLKTKRYTTTAFNNLIAAIGDIDITALTAHHATVWREHMMREGKADSNTATNYWQVVKPAIDRAVIHGWLPQNPWKGMRPPKKANKTRECKRKFAWTPLELDAIRTFCLPFYENYSMNDMVSALFPVIVIGLNTGMRTDEILNLKWSDIDFTQQVIHVVSDSQHKTKARKSRTIPIQTNGNEFINFLQSHRLKMDALFTEMWGPNCPVAKRIKTEFGSVDQNSIDSFTKRYYKDPEQKWLMEPGNAIAQANREFLITFRYQQVSASSISHAFDKMRSRCTELQLDQNRLRDITLYGVRHTYGTRMVDNGIKLPTLQVIMGHEDITTTMLYLTPDLDIPNVNMI